MKIFILSILATFSAIYCAFSQGALANAAVGLPGGVSCKTNRMGSQYYEWIIDGKHSLFIVGPDRLRTNEDLAWSMATNFESYLKSNFSKIQDIQSFQTRIEDVSLGIFSGKELITVRKSKWGIETYHTLYFLWDGTQMWTGHLSGGYPPAGSRPEDYEIVNRILLTIINRVSQPLSDDAKVTVE